MLATNVRFRCITAHSLTIFLPRVEDFVQQVIWYIPRVSAWTGVRSPKGIPSRCTDAPKDLCDPVLR